MLSTGLLALSPSFVTKPWGADDLSPWFDRTGLRGVGEVWLSSPGNLTSTGCALAEIPGGTDVPLVKFLFTNERLSVQVHPTDRYAHAHLGHGGKTEAWYIMRSEARSRLALGFTGFMEDRDVRRAVTNGSLESLLAWHVPRPGDIYLVPSGTVHAVGAGLVILEVQQPSDVTFRLYDYGRARELHIEQALAVADRSPYPERYLTRYDSRAASQRIVDAHGLSVWRRTITTARDITRNVDAPAIIVAVSGSGTLNGARFSPGSAYMWPTHVETLRVEPEVCCELIEAWLAVE